MPRQVGPNTTPGAARPSLRGVLCLALLGALAASGAPARTAADRSQQQKPAEKIVFPAGTPQPVIEWVASYTKESDVKPRKKRRWKKILLGEGGDRLEPTLIAPTAVAIGADDTLYVLDKHQNAVFVINSDQRRFQVFRGTGAGALSDPVGVAVSGNGRLFVSDAEAKVVFSYDSDLSYLTAFGGRDRFQRPTGVALSSDGVRLAICDTQAHRVYVLRAVDGVTMLELGSVGGGSADGSFHYPYAVAFDDQGYLYVTDYLNFRVQVFDGAGDFIFTFGQPGDRPGDMVRPRGITVDGDSGVIYVVDGAFQLIQMFNLDGEALMFFGQPGQGAAEFSLPTGIARRGELLAVADTLNHRVQVFRFLGVPSAPQ